MWITNTGPHQTLRMESGSKEEPQKRQLVLGLVLQRCYIGKGGGVEMGGERRQSYSKERCYFQDKQGGMLGSLSAQLFTTGPPPPLLWATFPSCFADEVESHFCHFV